MTFWISWQQPRISKFCYYTENVSKNDAHKEQTNLSSALSFIRFITLAQLAPALLVFLIPEITAVILRKCVSLSLSFVSCVFVFVFVSCVCVCVVVIVSGSVTVTWGDPRLSVCVCLSVWVCVYLWPFVCRSVYVWVWVTWNCLQLCDWNFSSCRRVSLSLMRRAKKKNTSMRYYQLFILVGTIIFIFYRPWYTIQSWIHLIQLSESDKWFWIRPIHMKGV